MKYKFIGKKDWKFPYLKTGKVYDLVVREESRGLFGFLVGLNKPVIREPFYCPYTSWTTFYRNWEQL